MVVYMIIMQNSILSRHIKHFLELHYEILLNYCKYSFYANALREGNCHFSLYQEKQQGYTLH